MIPPVPVGDLSALSEVDALLLQLRQDGEIDDVGEGVLRRHFDERAASLAEEFRLLLQDYQARAERDGGSAAEQWLAEASKALGRRDREHTQRVLATVVANPDSIAR